MNLDFSFTIFNKNIQIYDESKIKNIIFYDRYVIAEIVDLTMSYHKYKMILYKYRPYEIQTIYLYGDHYKRNFYTNAFLHIYNNLLI